MMIGLLETGRWELEAGKGKADRVQLWQLQRLRLEEGALLPEVFEERRALLGKWFDKWTDSQRRRILIGLLERCSLSQQKFCCRKLQEQIPAEALDFTTKLPRVLSVYIFSFLDPRSLCRCAQVSWHWKNVSELDQLWMLKCLRFNWRLDFSPSPFEQGVWKKHYIQMVKKLHVTKPKTPPKDGFVITNVQPVASSSPGDKQSPFRSSSTRRKNNLGERELPPWRSSDKHPTDIIRFNYLDNCDPFQPGSQGRRKRNETTPDFSQQSHNKKNKLQDQARLRKAQSLMSLSPSSPLGAPAHRAWPSHLFVGPPPPGAAAETFEQQLQSTLGDSHSPSRFPKPS
ncbi:F-box only protein 16 isoform X3 [Cavia porcellus]|uniref:F-box only protein 16 isoform X3 n=1 Tax=Cavia porcellus TaxID=10141 RepID=UPI000C8776D1|nr:F-box only protein 16 isoform X1 [Cavia porcellus]